MKKMSKILALMLSFVLVIGALAACGGKENISTGSTYTYWANLDNRSSRTISSYNEMLYYQEVSKATGIDVEFIHPAAGSTGGEAFQVLLASGDYPDIIEYNWYNYPGGADTAISDNVIISLNDYLEDYAPNFYDYMEGERGKEKDYIYKVQAITNAGNYYGFSSLCIGNYRTYEGLYVRKDKLDEWKLDVPVTIDDWTNLFKVAKENGIEVPFTCNANVFSFTACNLFNSAWNVAKNFYIDDDKVKFGPFEESYKDYVAQMAEWMKLGYLDKDYVTNTTTEISGYITSGKSIAAHGYVGGDLGSLLPAMAERDPNFDLVACPYPVLKEGDTPFIQEIETEVLASNTAAVSVQCGAENENRYKEAITWLDYLYSDEGMALKFFGVEGDTYTIEKGEDGEDHFVYTDKIFDYEKIGAHSVQDALYKFMRPGGGPGFSEHPDYFEGFYQYEQQKDAIKVWNENVDVARANVVPPLKFTTDESSEMASIMANAQKNLDAAISNIILGKASIDTYDSAVKAAKNGGYDRLIEIYNDAYVRYNEIVKEANK